MWGGIITAIDNAGAFSIVYKTEYIKHRLTRNCELIGYFLSRWCTYNTTGRFHYSENWTLKKY